MEKIEGVDFKGALKMLAERTGVEIKYDGPKKSKEELDEKAQMFAAMNTAAEFYYQRLQENEAVKTYLLERGFTEDTITHFQIGFAPDDWHALEKVLVTSGYSLDILEKVGVSIKGDKGHYDRFRSRIMFPIRDTAGRVVAFSGRIFGEEDERTAKYINSPETELYSKSKVLYGYDMAKQAIRKHDFAILVEGQMDLVACHQAGYTNTVAISGTALTQEHCKILGRMSQNIVLALDADAAGVKAAGRSAIIALQNGFDAKVARLPEGLDPADVLKAQDGLTLWKSLIKDAKHIVEFLLVVYAEQYGKDERIFKKKVEEEVLPFVARIQSKIDQEHFIKVVAGKIGASESAVSLALASVRLPKEGEEAVVSPARTHDYRKQFSPLSVLVAILAWQKGVKEPVIEIQAIEERVASMVSDLEYKAALETVSEGEITYVESMYGTPEAVQAVVAERLEYLQQSMWRAERLRLTQALQKAEGALDDEQVAQLHTEINTLNSKLDALGRG
jgi:DNA primase